jgi:hypothetical protein
MIDEVVISPRRIIPDERSSLCLRQIEDFERT